MLTNEEKEFVAYLREKPTELGNRALSIIDHLTAQMTDLESGSEELVQDHVNLSAECVSWMDKYNVLKRDREDAEEHSNNLQFLINQKNEKLSALLSAAGPVVAYTKTYNNTFNNKFNILHYSENGEAVKVTLGDLRRLDEAVRKAKE